MYEFADVAVEYLRERFIELFVDFKASLAGMDEISLLNATKKLYERIDELFREMMYRVAVYAYENADGSEPEEINDGFLTAIIFDEYDPVLKYVYSNELERKCARLFESLVATGYDTNEIDTALKHLMLMVTQYALVVTREATILGYRSNGFSAVQWICNIDGRECEKCRERHERVYRINKVPREPHIGCRCEIIPYE